MSKGSTLEELERNKAVALRFKKNQGTPQMAQVEREVLAPNYDRARGGSFHLAANARDQGWPHPGMYLRTSFPDRVDAIERVVAEGDRVGLLFRINATHSGSYFGIPPTGRKLDVYECAFIRIAGSQMVEGWFMMDEAEKLRQLGASLPARNDRALVAPAVPTAGSSASALLDALLANAEDSPEYRNKVAVLRGIDAAFRETSLPQPRQTRLPLQHLHAYAATRGSSAQTLATALPDMRLRVEVLIAEGDQVWARCNFDGTHRAPLYGIEATGRKVGVPVVILAKVLDGKWTESWQFADELGLLLQLGEPDLLLQNA
jgi:predicted ester cyclase